MKKEFYKNATELSEKVNSLKESVLSFKGEIEEYINSKPEVWLSTGEGEATVECLNEVEGILINLEDTDSSLDMIQEC